MSRVSTFQHMRQEFKLQTETGAVRLHYDRGGTLPTVEVDAIDNHGVFNQVLGTGLTEIEAATEAVKAMLRDRQKFTVDDWRPKRQNRKDRNLLQSDTRFNVVIRYRDEVFCGQADSFMPVQAYVLALFDAIGKALTAFTKKENKPPTTTA